MIWIPVVYLALTLAVLLFQRRLIYHPMKLPAAEAERIAAEEGFAPWRNAGGEIVGWMMPSGPPSAGSVLVAHGNAGSASMRDYIAGPIHEALPLDVYVLEYPGYGARAGSPSMDSLLAAGEEALALLPRERPVYLVSESLGAGVAAHLAKTQPSRIEALVMFVPYDDLAAVGQTMLPFLPVKYLMWDRFQPAQWLADYRGPVKIVLAGADEVIPPRLGRRLYEGYPGPKSLQVVEGARHNDVTWQTPAWWAEVLSSGAAVRRP
jgi:pimeloyl-ACP methyl ester carboxylesterase